MNKTRFSIWTVILIAWIAIIKITKYSVGQFYAKEVATGQFDQYTDSYKMLRTSNTVDTFILIVGLGFALFSLYMMYKSFKLAKKVEK